MEFLIELILELIFEGSMEISSNRKVPKIIRYPLIGLIFLCFLFVFGIILFVAIISYKESIILSILFIIIDIFLVIGFIKKFKELYLSKKNIS